MQSLPSVASGAWIVFIKISAMKALRLDGMSAPFSPLLLNVRDLYCWWELRFPFPWPHSDAGSTVAALLFHTVMPKVSQERYFRREAWVCWWCVGETKWATAERMFIFVCLSVCEMENSLHGLKLPLVWWPSHVYGQNMTKGFSEAKCGMLCVGQAFVYLTSVYELITFCSKKYCQVLQHQGFVLSYSGRWIILLLNNHPWNFQIQRKSHI